MHDVDVVWHGSLWHVLLAVECALQGPIGLQEQLECVRGVLCQRPLHACPPAFGLAGRLFATVI